MKRLLIAIALVCVLSGTALAGEMPGVNSVRLEDDVPTVGSMSTTQVTGDMSGVNYDTATESSVIMTVLLTLINLVGR